LISEFPVESLGGVRLVFIPIPGFAPLHHKDAGQVMLKSQFDVVLATEPGISQQEIGSKAEAEGLDQ